MAFFLFFLVYPVVDFLFSDQTVVDGSTKKQRMSVHLFGRLDIKLKSNCSYVEYSYHPSHDMKNFIYKTKV